MQFASALLVGADTLAYHVAGSSIKGEVVVGFLGQVARPGDERPTVVLLANGSIHHAIGLEVHER